jgi:glycolate oxidase FAD binding subunit
LRDFVLGAKIMDGQGQIMNFGGTVMKNVAGYDVSRLMPASLGTLALLLDVSIKVLPKPAATATLTAQINQAEAIHLMNLLASQPWPLSASAWQGEQMGQLHILKWCQSSSCISHSSFWQSIRHEATRSNGSRAILERS